MLHFGSSFLFLLHFYAPPFAVETSGSNIRVSQTQPNMFSSTQLSEVSPGDERENKLSVTSVYTAAHLILHTLRRRVVPFRCNYSRFQKHPFRRADFVNRRWRTGAE